MRILLFLFCIISIWAQDFQNIDAVQRYLATLPIEKKVELALFHEVTEGKKSNAALLLSILNNPPFYKEHFIENILMLPPQTTAIVVDKTAQKLYLLHNEANTTKIEEFPCITGKKPGDKLQKGDQRTPNGIYFTKYFIDPKDLSPIYGNGAFPLNYPNIIDKQFFKKSGSGIWLHATNNDKRPPFSSNGCVVMTNTNFDRIKPSIQFRQTPIVIVEKIASTNKDDFLHERLSLGYFIYKWKKAWEESTHGNVEPYLSYYCNHFVSHYGSKAAFAKHKRDVSRNKKWIDIKLKNLTLAKDGRILDFGHIYVAAFDMEYKSNNYSWKGKKILYIIKEDGQWKILAEENL